MLSIKILNVVPVIDYRVRLHCILSYPGHPKGCPMFGKRPECPSQAPHFEDYFNMDSVFKAVVCEFNLYGHAQQMLEKHPHWTQKQCRNPLYWQNSVRKQLRETCKKLIKRGQDYTLIPEAMGMDVVATMKNVGIVLEFPPKHVVRKIAIIGWR